MIKAAIREQLRNILDDITPDRLKRKSREACEKLCQTPEFNRAKTIMMFLSLPREIDTTCALSCAFQQGKTVLVPTVSWHKKTLMAITLSSLDCEMTEDHYGLRNPTNAIAVDPSQIDLVVVPGLGFDNQGYRLGRGGGYYDKFLAQRDFKGMTCGIALEEQVLDQIPIADHDIAIDMLVTDKKTRRFEKKL